MKTSKELRKAYKNLEEEIEKSFDNLTEHKEYNFLRKVMEYAGEPVDEMDEDDMIDVLSNDYLHVNLLCIQYYSYNKYKDTTGSVLSITDGLVHVIEDGDGIITDSVKFRNISIISRINLLKYVEEFNNEE